MPATQPKFEQPELKSPWGFYQHPFTGQQVPSVTKISGLLDKPHLITWGANMTAEWAVDNFDELASLSTREARLALLKDGGKQYREAGRNKGSMVHTLIEQTLAGLAPEVPQDCRHNFNGWLAWLAEFVDHFEQVEATVWSHRFGYAGTVDAIARFKDGRRVLVDYKTGKDVYAEAALQLAGLRFADVIVTTEGEFPLGDFDATGLLHLPDPVLTPTGKASVKGGWSWREVTADAEDFETFCALRRAYSWEHGKAKDVIGGKQTKRSPK